MEKIKKYTKNKILIFQGSDRNKESCPDQKSKTMKIIEQSIKNLPKEIDLEIIDLSVDNSGYIIQPCKGCMSTSSSQCHWFCDCYGPGKEFMDKMYKDKIYEKLEQCDGFLVYSPIYWWSLSSQVKSMFDRLVCASMTMTTDEAIEMLGEDNLKNSKVTKKFSKTQTYKRLQRNHLEGKIGGFFVHGDNGGDDYVDRKLPKSYTKYDIGDFNEPKKVVLPFVWQCRYMGIDVPEDLITSFYMNEGLSYSESNDKMDEGELNWVVEKSKKLILKMNDKINREKGI